MKLRQRQFAALRAHYVGAGLIESFRDTKQLASRDIESGDVLVRDSRGNTTRLGFDDRGFIGHIVSPLGRTWRLENDADGKLLGLINPAGLHLGIQYYADGKPAVVSRDSQTLFNLSYDLTGSLSQVAYHDQTTTTIQHEAPDRIAAVTHRAGVTEAYKYDSDGDLIVIADGNDNLTTFKYSTWHKPDSAHYADGSSESYEYNPAGLVSRIVAESTPVADIEYDEAGHPTLIGYSDGEVLRFKYDENENLIEASNEHATIKYEYDENSMVILEDQAGQIIRYHFDDATLTALTCPTGERIEFNHDEDLRLSSIKDWNGGLHCFNQSLDDHQIVLNSPNGLATFIEKSQAGLVESILVAEGGSKETKRFSLSYQYDDEDRVALFTDSDFGVRKYVYDSESQILSVWANQSDRNENFEYDAAGNRRRSNGDEASFNALNHLTSQGSTQCIYDARGNLDVFSSPDRSWRFTYNRRNLLVRAEDQFGQVVTFGYDAFARRIWKRSRSSRVSYVWAGEHLIREVTERDGRIVERDYLYIPGTHTPLAMRADEQIYYYHTDQLGTPRRLTDSQGKIVWSADYTAFGQARIKVSAIANALRLPGHYFDEETGLHYNRFRYYSPDLGRYLSRDPITYLGGLNFYCYAGNDPINAIDPLGLAWWKTALKIVAAVAVGVAVTAAVIVAAPVVLAAVGVSAAAIAAGTVGAAAITATAIVAGGAAAGAVGFGLNEALEHGFSMKCLKEAGRGALIGAAAALPFAAIPFAPFLLPAAAATAAAGVGGYSGAGAISGAIGYSLDVASDPNAKWSWWGFTKAVGIGAATGGVGRYLGGKYAKWKESKSAASGSSGKPIPERGYHKEVISNKPLKPQDAHQEWEKFLGEGPYSNKHPRTGQPDPDRLVSADGQRSIRYGDHEMNSSPGKHHYHEETWTYDAETNTMNVDNTVRRVPLNQGGKKQ